MLSIDWRAPAVYKHADKIPAAGFAWEYLRRDDEYHQDYERMVSRGPSVIEALDAFSHRWGLRFPPRPQ